MTRHKTVTERGKEGVLYRVVRADGTVFWERFVTFEDLPRGERGEAALQEVAQRQEREYYRLLISDQLT